MGRLRLGRRFLATTLAVLTALVLLRPPRTFAAPDDVFGYWEVKEVKSYTKSDSDHAYDSLVSDGASVYSQDSVITNVSGTETTLAASELVYAGGTSADYASAQLSWSAPQDRIVARGTASDYTLDPAEITVSATGNFQNVQVTESWGATYYDGVFGGVELRATYVPADEPYDFDAHFSSDTNWGKELNVLCGINEWPSALGHNPGRVGDLDNPNFDEQTQTVSGTASLDLTSIGGIGVDYDGTYGDTARSGFVPDRAGTYYVIVRATVGDVSHLVVYAYAYTGDGAGTVLQVENSAASANPGEDAGVDIRSDIFEAPSPVLIAAALGIAGVAGAAAIASSRKRATRKKSDNGKEKKEPPKQYRMYVYKEFGDAIKRGAAPVRVYARIAEVVEGAERDCLRQTERIQASGTCLEVRTVGVEGRYMCAEVGAQADAQDEKGTVTFTLAGPYGAIRRGIVFRLVGDPWITFPARTGDGGWDLAKDCPGVSMVAGLGGKDRQRFVFMDAVEEPKKISFLNRDGFEIREEREPKAAYTYDACIENLTRPMLKEGSVFAEVERREITVEAEFSGNVKVRGTFEIQLYPQGLSVLVSGGGNPLRSSTPGVRQVLQDGWMEVISYATREKGESTLDPLIPPTDFDPCFAQVRPDGTALISTKPSTFSFETLQETTEETKNILAKYHYEIHWHQNGYAFRPEDSLPEAKNDQRYHVLLPMIASEETFSDKVMVPVRLLGEPFDPYKSWQHEFDGLCDTAVRYFPEDVAQGWVDHIRTTYNDPNVWDAGEIRAMRSDVIRAAQDFWTAQYAFQMRLITYYDLTEAIFKKPARFMADVALAIVIHYYCGQHEVWITPCKDLFLDCVDEGLWSYVQTGTADFNFIENLLTRSTDWMENYIGIADGKGMGLTFNVRSKDTRQLAMALCGFMLADFLKNYYKMEPKDFFECLRTSFFDLSQMALRKLVGAGMTRCWNSEVMQGFFKKKWVKTITDYIKREVLPEVAHGDAKLIDPKTGKIVSQDNTRIVGNVDERVMGTREFINKGKAGEVLNTDNLDFGHTALSEKDMAGDLQLVHFDFGVDDPLLAATYRDLVQSALNTLFGMGIATVVEGTDLDPTSGGFGTLTLPVYRLGGKVRYAKVDLISLFTNGTSSLAFGAIYLPLFGDFKTPSTNGKRFDVGRFVLSYTTPGRI